MTSRTPVHTGRVASQGRSGGGAFEWPLVPWTLMAVLGLGVVLLDLLGAPIGYAVQLAGLLLLGVGVIGGVLHDRWRRRG